jgi:hypothetical protein
VTSNCSLLATSGNSFGVASATAAAVSVSSTQPPVSLISASSSMCERRSSCVRVLPRRLLVLLWCFVYLCDALQLAESEKVDSKALFDQVGTTLVSIERVQRNHLRTEYGSVLQHCKVTLKTLDNFCRRSYVACNQTRTCAEQLEPWKARVHDLSVNLERLTSERIREREAHAVRVRELEAKLSAARQTTVNSIDEQRLMRTSGTAALFGNKWMPTVGNRLHLPAVLLLVGFGYLLCVFVGRASSWLRYQRSCAVVGHFRARNSTRFDAAFRWVRAVDLLCAGLFLMAVFFPGPIARTMMESERSLPLWSSLCYWAQCIACVSGTSLNAFVLFSVFWRARSVGALSAFISLCLVRSIHLVASVSVLYHSSFHWRMPATTGLFNTTVEAAHSYDMMTHRLRIYYLTYGFIFMLMAWDTHQQLTDHAPLRAAVLTVERVRRLSKSRRPRAAPENALCYRSLVSSPRRGMEPSLESGSSRSFSTLESGDWKTPPLRRVVAEKRTCARTVVSTPD